MTVNTINDLQVYPTPEAGKVYHVLGYHSINDGGGGEFYWDSTSSEAPDNGTIFTGSISGRWKRVVYDTISLKWFGAMGNGTNDDHMAIQSCIDCGKAKSKKIVFDAGTFCTTETLVIYDGTEISGAGRNTLQNQLNTIIRKTTNNKNAHPIDAVFALEKSPVKAFSTGFHLSGIRLEYNLTANNTVAKGTNCLAIGSAYHFSLKNIACSNATYGIFGKSIWGSEMEDVYIADCLRGLYANPTLENSMATACTSLQIKNIKIDNCVTALFFWSLFYSNISGYCQNVNTSLPNCPSNEMPVCFFLKKSSNVTLQFGCETDNLHPGNAMLFYGGLYISLKLNLQIPPTAVFKKDALRDKIGGEDMQLKEQAFISCNAGSILSIEDAQLDFQQLATPPYTDYSNTSSMFYVGDSQTLIKLNGGYLSTDCYSLIAPETGVSANNVVSNGQRFFSAKNFTGQDVAKIYDTPAFKSGIKLGSIAGNNSVLSDYMEGVFTPVLNFGNVSTGITYHIQEGAYTRCGDLVFVSMYVYVSSKGTATGGASISGLPFASKVLSGLVYTGTCLVGGMNNVAGQVFYWMNEGAQHISLQTVDNGVFNPNALTDLNFTNSSRLIINMTYKAV